MTSLHSKSLRPAFMRSAFLYAAVLLAGSALFFALHYIGARIPYDLTLEKALTELDSDRPDLGYLSGIIARFEYCQRVSLTLAAAKPLEGDNPLVDAALPRAIATAPPVGYCERIRLLRTADDLGQHALVFRYWWGSAALYSIALRFLSDADMREWTRLLTIFAWGLLALALWFLSRKAFLAIAPLGIFAAFFSGLQYFSDAAEGFPFLLAPLSGAALALALIASRRSPARAARLCCFVIGMISSYLWFFDGHNTLMVVLIGMTAYFGSGGGARRRVGNAAMLVGLYIAGFALCYAFGQLVRAGVAEWAADWTSARDVFEGFSQRASVHGDRIRETLTLTSADGWMQTPIIRDFRPYWIMGPDRVAFGQTVTLLSALAFAVSLAFAAAQFLQGRKSLLADVAWIAAMAAATAAQFILPDDFPNRSSRYLFIAHALCWSSFLLAAREALARWKETIGPAAEGAPASAQGNRRSRRAAGRGRPSSSSRRPRLRLPKDAALRVFLAVAVAAAGAGALFGATLLRSDAAFARETIAGTQPRISGPFNVYYNENKLVYERAECDEYDAAPLFFLHLSPADPNDLPEERQSHSFDNPDFHFTERKVPYGGGCAAVVNLPDYEITAISTGQYISGERQIWNGGFRVFGRQALLDAAFARETIAGTQPRISNLFNVYYNENRLVYAKAECDERDTASRFNLHILPVNLNDLPDDRAEHGFDNRDFLFAARQVPYEDGCAAVVDLPDYEIAAVSTGQFIGGERQIWNGEFRLSASAP